MESSWESLNLSGLLQRQEISGDFLSMGTLGTYVGKASEESLGLPIGLTDVSLRFQQMER